MGTHERLFSIGIVGATGAVGQELLKVLISRRFPVSLASPNDIRLFASSRSEGKQIQFQGQSYTVQAMSKEAFQGLDFIFFDASDAVSKEWVPVAESVGAWVIDNSATFRMDPETPLLVPNVNGSDFESWARGRMDTNHKRIAGPNCSTVQLVVPLKALDQQFGLDRVVVSSYQSVSGAGASAIDELKAQTLSILQGGTPVEPSALSYRIAFNCIPAIGKLDENGVTSEERKIIEESRKILGLRHLRISATAVRVPTISCHGESVNVELKTAAKIGEVRACLAAQDGLILVDDPGKMRFPMAEPWSTKTAEKISNIEPASGSDLVYVGRVRMDDSLQSGLNFWVIADNLRKGAASNAVEIAEWLIKVAAI